MITHTLKPFIGGSHVIEFWMLLPIFIEVFTKFSLHLRLFNSSTSKTTPFDDLIFKTLSDYINWGSLLLNLPFQHHMIKKRKFSGSRFENILARQIDCAEIVMKPSHFKVRKIGVSMCIYLLGSGDAGFAP